MAAGKRGKRERRPRGFQSRPHLGLRWLVVAAPRAQAEAGGVARGGGVGEVGEELGRWWWFVVLAGSARRPFIGGMRRWRRGVVVAAGGERRAGFNGGGGRCGVVTRRRRDS